ncbi:hypothetical protein LCGC14_1578650 [marine sediment metagenome]|uniref:Uncharacterized protein n=1 Tax=marine sediment metagenome TaxID=412755 RepID=A0A0F9KYI3_9ZZZZ|nr:hypothetical protein [Candidatus Scalindua sp.]
MNITDLNNCVKNHHESYEEFASRHNIIVDKLNEEIPNDLCKYSHITCIVPRLKTNLDIQMSYYFKHITGFILSNTGQPWKGKGDLLFRTAWFALFRKDYRMLNRCYHLIQEGRRWPKSLDDPRGRKYEHRNPFRLTRDIYIALDCAAYQMGISYYISKAKPPWYIYRPAFNTWRKYLITGEQKDKERYERWAAISLWFTPNMPAYAIFNNCWMAWVAKSEKVQRTLSKHVPDWNLCQRQLINHPMKNHDELEISAFEPGEGMIWQWDDKRYWSEKRKLLPRDEEYYLDRESLKYVHEENLKQ